MQRENKWQARLARDFTHREDSKKPQLHPKSLWNVKLLFFIQSEIDRAVAEERSKFKDEMDRLQCEGISVQVECDWYINYRDLENYLENLNK